MPANRSKERFQKSASSQHADTVSEWPSGPTIRPSCSPFSEKEIEHAQERAFDAASLALLNAVTVVSTTGSQQRPHNAGKQDNPSRDQVSSHTIPFSPVNDTISLSPNKAESKQDLIDDSPSLDKRETSKPTGSWLTSPLRRRAHSLDRVFRAADLADRTVDDMRPKSSPRPQSIEETEAVAKDKEVAQAIGLTS